MLNRFEATLADVDKALPLSAQAGELHYARGLALLSLGRADEAVAAMKSAQEPGDQAASSPRASATRSTTRANTPTPKRRSARRRRSRAAKTATSH